MATTSVNSKKRIIFDASVLVSGNVSGDIYKTGLYRVSYEILSNLCKQNLYELFLFDVFFRERELIKFVQKDFPGCFRLNVHSYWYRILFFPIGGFIDKLRVLEDGEKRLITDIPAWILKNILIIIEKVAKKIDKSFFRTGNLIKEIDKCDLYYSTYFPMPEQIRSDKKIKKVYTIHDIIPILHPEYFSSPYNYYLVKEVVDSISLEDYIICVSESTKKDLITYRADLNPDHAFVALLAASENFQPVSNVEEINRIKKKFKIPLNINYLLSVCTLEPRKNLKTVIESFRNILQKVKTRDLVLVLTGSPGWKSDLLIEEIKELNKRFNNSIILTGFVTDNELAVLYSGAYAFLYPSLYEGFGLPPLEAMQCGAPVITSNSSSLPEVIGDCGIMIDPTSISELTDAITLLYENKRQRNLMSKKAIRRAACFNFNYTVDIILKIFNLALR